MLLKHAKRRSLIKSVAPKMGVVTKLFARNYLETPALNPGYDPESNKINAHTETTLVACVCVCGPVCYMYTVKPPNKGHFGSSRFKGVSEVSTELPFGLYLEEVLIQQKPLQ